MVVGRADAGQASEFAPYFDIDWDAGPILLPILDADEEKALAELSVADGRAALLRARVPARPGHRTTARPGRCTSASTTSWCPGGAGPPS